MADNKTVRILITLFLGLLGLAIFANLAMPRGDAVVLAPTAYPEVFPGVNSTDIKRVYLESRDTGRKLTLVKVPGDWVGTDEKGETVQVDANQITKVISVLPALRYNRVMTESDLKDFGLADGGMFIVQFDADKSYTLHVGGINADQTLSYVQRDDDHRVLQVPVQPVANLVGLVAAPVTATPGTSGSVTPEASLSSIPTDSSMWNLSP